MAFLRIVGMALIWALTCSELIANPSKGVSLGFHQSAGFMSIKLQLSNKLELSSLKQTTLAIAVFLYRYGSRRNGKDTNASHTPANVP